MIFQRKLLYQEADAHAGSLCNCDHVMPQLYSSSHALFLFNFHSHS